ncbi:MAG: hypothetical protein Q9162_006463 [Coniocarpon cinnabarinum]
MHTFFTSKRYNDIEVRSTAAFVMAGQGSKLFDGLPSPRHSPRSLSPVDETSTSHDRIRSPVPSGNAHSRKADAALNSLQTPLAPLKSAQYHIDHQRKRSSSLPTQDSAYGYFDNAPVKDKPRTLASEEPKRTGRPDVLKMSPSQIFNFTSAPDSLPIRPLTPESNSPQLSDSHDERPLPHNAARTDAVTPLAGQAMLAAPSPPPSISRRNSSGRRQEATKPFGQNHRPSKPSRSLSIPVHMKEKEKATDSEKESRPSPFPPANARRRVTSVKSQQRERTPSYRADHTKDSYHQTPSSIPIPPFSLPTYLQLELSAQRPSPLYIYRSSTADTPFESTKIKFERLKNFLLVPPYVENILLFGALSCLDSWLYTFTVMPLRFFKSLWMLMVWAVRSLMHETTEMTRFIASGLPRLWERRRRDSNIAASSRRPSTSNDSRKLESLLDTIASNSSTPLPARFIEKVRGHRRSRSAPSALQQNHKADLLSGLLVIIGCVILSQFDASRMYHNIRGQAAIKLYVIYNVLEVCDRLLSALGQDIMECLFSTETLERKPNGRSKVLQPLWMFALALVYTVAHATVLFYQVITLNVAVNSYSNALLTLLMSNQFVEIKGTVFKKFEKENLFQLTCADIVERFQLWIMLLIIALRNIVEVGGISITSSAGIFSGPSSSSSPPSAPNATNPVASTFGILPHAFQTLPSLFPFQVLSPFLVVLGSEMIVDWLKHAYITKFNATSPRIYSRFLDILAKDYYTHAFADQSLMKRIGLPVIPLACLFIRATLQTYHMFLATNINPPSISTATSLASAHTEAEPTSSPILAQLDMIFRRALGHSSLGGGANSNGVFSWTLDDGIALATMLLFFLALYLLLLALKLALGMILLGVARNRYACMLERERKSEKEKMIETESKRLGGWGVAELGDERRKTIYEGHENELRRIKEKEIKAKEAEERDSLSGKGLKAMEGVERYAMVAKRIW